MEDGKIQNDWLNHQNISKLALAALTVIGLYLCYLFALPFLPAFALALVLAGISRPIHRFVKKYLKNANLAAGLSVFLVAAAIVAPVFFLGRQIAREVMRGTEEFREQIKTGAWRERLEQNSYLAAALNWLETEADLAGTAMRLAGQIPAFLSDFVVGSGQAVAQVFIAFFILFFFFRDQDEILRGIRGLMPLTDDEADFFFKRISDTLYASVNGLLLVGAAQGFLGGIMFWILGLPAAAMWGFVMAFFALLPFFGAWMIWIPGAIFLALSGEYVKALVLLGWGFTAVSLIDNLLYPMIVGDRLRFHTLLILIALVGGIAVFGASGIVFGPVVLAITAALLDVWRKRAALEKKTLAENCSG